MAPAIDLQQLLLAASYQLALEGASVHEDIPDDPTSESERRQPLFFRAAGLPAFYVHKRIAVMNCCAASCVTAKNTRSSWRHADYLRVSLSDYCHALLAFLEETATGIIEDFDANLLLGDLRWRLADKRMRASERMVSEIVNSCGEQDAMRTNAAEFNRAAEKYYRDDLRQAQLREALHYLREDVAQAPIGAEEELRTLIRCGVRVQDPLRFLESIGDRMLREELSAGGTGIAAESAAGAFRRLRTCRNGYSERRTMANRA